MSQSIYETVSRDIEMILRDIIDGRIGLPELQRPFVWKNDKVRDLLDSIYRGLPIGYVMFWKSSDSSENKTRVIGEDTKEYKRPDALVIDGQQRLTALVASIYGQSVIDKDYKKRTVRIAFNPITEEFKNADASTDRDKEFISCIYELFEADRDNRFPEYRKKYIEELNISREKKGLESINEYEIENKLNNLLSIIKYRIPTMTIFDFVDEELVADIFVRINSKGTILKQDDFVMTLLSVYEPQAREQIENFCRDSRIPAPGTSFNSLIDVDATHIIRATVALGFNRGRMRYAYQLLRGKDLKTKEIKKETRDANLLVFKEALSRVIDLNSWHEFINIVADAGYVSSNLITSQVCFIFNYVLYLIGKNTFKVNNLKLKKAIARWFFASHLTTYYVGSFETILEQQLNDLALLNTEDEFLSYLDKQTMSLLTEDYFSITLPNELDVRQTGGPSWCGFVASQVVLGSKSWLSNTPLSSLLLPSSSGQKNALDKHHVFPNNYLRNKGYGVITDNRANFVCLDYQTNIEISDEKPSVYASKFLERLGKDKFNTSCEENAIPNNFYEIEYPQFLETRRKLMSDLIKKAFNRL